MIFWEFPTKSSLLVFNFWEAENLLFSILDFSGATGLGIEQTQSPRFRIFEMDDMELLKEAKGAGKIKRDGLARSPPKARQPKSFGPPKPVLLQFSCHRLVLT